MRFFLIAALSLCCAVVQAQKLRPGIKTLVKTIDAYNELDHEHVGIAGTTTDQYRNFIKLRDKATTIELLTLLEHKNAVVQGYASWALADKKYLKLSEILTVFLESGEKVSVQHGCIASRNTLANEFYFRVRGQSRQNKLSDSDSIFYNKQLVKLDGIILYFNKPTRLLSTVLEKNNANPKTYDRIRTLATIDPDPSVLVALAEYKKQTDIPFLIAKGKYAFPAISVFPDKAFWAFLSSYKSKEMSMEYFLAVASYKNEAALDLLDHIYKNCDTVQVGEWDEPIVSKLDEALIKNYNPLYQNLILKIWEQHKTIDFTVTQQLVAASPEKSAKSFATGLLAEGNFNFLEIDQNYGTTELILPLVLRTISQYNQSQLYSICNKNVLTTEFYNLYAFLTFIKENRMTQVSGTIIQRLKEERQAYEIFHLTETLLSFNNTETNKELMEILRLNKKYWDWGNWLARFEEIFKEYSIQFK